MHFLFVGVQFTATDDTVMSASEEVVSWWLSNLKCV